MTHIPCRGLSHLEHWVPDNWRCWYRWHYRPLSDRQIPAPTRTTSSFTLDPKLINRESYKAHLRRAINITAPAPHGRQISQFLVPLHLCARIYVVLPRECFSYTCSTLSPLSSPVTCFKRDFYGCSSLSLLLPRASSPRIIFQSDSNILLSSSESRLGFFLLKRFFAA